MPSKNNNKKGRVRSQDRDTNDSTKLLGSKIKLIKSHTLAVIETESNEISDSLRKNYRNRIQHVMDFWKNEYPDYYSVGVRKVTKKELKDPVQYWHNNKEDLVYTGLNVKFFKAFLAKKKMKLDGKPMGLVNLRKYRDAIQWGSREAKEPLPSSFFNKTEKFMKSYKKEAATKKKDGLMEDKAADPISWTLFVLFLNWSLQNNNIFVRVYSILQWNCMARSINISPMGLHNITSAEDYIKIVYDKTKKDQEGEKVRDKHLYANPSLPIVCVFVSLGVYFALEDGRFKRTSLLFNKNNIADDAASSRYCNQWKEIFTQHEAEVRNHIRFEKANVHGVRKGSATKAVSETTCPPSIASIANRGEWSLGLVLDVYWHFSEPGDHYLGRVLTGLDPNKPDFGMLPPHFNMEGNPMDNKDVNEAMHLMYGSIIEQWGESTVDPIGILLKCLASVVHSSSWLLSFGQSIAGHPFQSIPILNRPELLSKLKLLVTTEPVGQVKTATGIPPHTQSAIMCRNILEVSRETLEEVKTISLNIKEAVGAALEEKAEQNGQLTGEKLKEVLGLQYKNLSKLVDTKINDLIDSLMAEGGLNRQEEEENLFNNNEFADGREDDDKTSTSDSAGKVRHQLYCYNGKFYHTPESFKFPVDLKLDTGWKLWLTGHPSHTIINAENQKLMAAPVRPYRLLNNRMLPKQLARDYGLKFCPIYRLMEKAPGLQLKNNIEEMDAEYLNNTFRRAKAYLQSKVEYIFNNEKWNPDNWFISTWSLRVQRSSILKYGTRRDVERLPEEKWINKKQKGIARTTADGSQTKRRRTGLKRNKVHIVNTSNRTLLGYNKQQENNNNNASQSKQQSNNNKHPRRAGRLKTTGLESSSSSDDDDDNDERAALPDLRKSWDSEKRKQMERRSAEIDKLMGVQKDVEKVRQCEKNRRNKVGDAVGTGGDKIFIVKRRSTRATRATRASAPHDPNFCQGCGKAAGPVHKCDVCGSNMHPFCGRGIGEEKYGQFIRCKFCDSNST